MIIDRIEGTVAVIEVEKGEVVDVPLTRIVGSARDGAVVERNGDDYVVDEDATAERARSMAERRRQLFQH